MNINLVFDANAASMMPTGMVAALQYAANFYDAWLASPITVNIEVGYGEIDGVPLTSAPGILDGAADGRFNYVQTSYSALAPMLAAQNGGAFLPATDPAGGAGIELSNAEAKALGIMSATATGIDGYMGFNYEPNFALDPNNRAQPGMEDFTAIALHEISEALGRRADDWGVSGEWTVADLYRYSAPGVISQDGAANYFSTDGGATNLGNYYSQGQDYLDWDFATTGLDAFRGGVAVDAIAPITPRDEALMTALGFIEGMGVPTTVIGSTGSTRLVEVGSNYYFYKNGFGPSLKSGGVAVTDGQYAGAAPVDVEQTATGYAVAWQVAGTNQYEIWSTDSNGNFVSNLTGGVVTLIESIGSTSLAEMGNNYHLYTNGSGPTLKSGGVAVTDGQYAGVVPIAAEKTATGYEVAWQYANDQYAVWSTDSNGNFVSNLTGGVVSGSNATLEALETTFQQDLNGDGTIGVHPTIIESVGSTSLVETGNNYFLYNNGSGPSLKSGGVAIVDGQFPGLAPIGAEQTATGYDVAWQVVGTNQFEVWSTDSSGNFVSNLTGGLVSGTNAILEALETAFNQDLNGDGTIGAHLTVIESIGSTSLVETGNNYYLDTNGSGPSLKSGGVAITDGQYAGAAPIAAEQTASGYDVAWKYDSGQYIVWSTDSSGNFVSNLTGGVVSGSDATLETLETTFHQDLNGDGIIGVPTMNSTTASLVDVGNTYYLYTNGAGPSLKSGGVAVTDSQYAGVTPFAVEQTATGYDVAWKVAGTDQFEVWNTDSNGNFVSNLTGGLVSGSSVALQTLETTFNRDLNGDGAIGVHPTVIESIGSTSLVEAGGNFYFYTNGSGPSLKSGGVAVMDGQYAGVTPIAVEQTATGYDVAWKYDSGQYTVWSTDNNGNFVSNLTGGVVSGSNATMEALETTFKQDLNGDRTIGVHATTIESIGSTSLIETGNNFYFFTNGSGPSLKSGGAPVTDSQFPGLTPIAAEQTATGYDVAWKVAGANQFEVWSTDSSGNFVANLTGGLVLGSDVALQTLESTFHQDLNGDGTIGVHNPLHDFHIV